MPAGMNTAPGNRLFEGVEVQRHVIGALILRELHTRYGRDNIGYLWMIVEPMLLAATVALLHGGQTAHYGPDIQPVPFAATGYCVFMIFRSILARAETTLEANKPLLFHRMVTIFDMLAARAVLEALATTATLALLLAGAWALGLAAPPARPLVLLAAIALMTWFAFALSMLVCTAAYFSKAVSKIIHPAIYILMPLSGAFFLLEWIPEPYRGWLAWSPMVQIFELVHMGGFVTVEGSGSDPIFMLACCLGLTLLGLLSLRIVRRHVHLS